MKSLRFISLAVLFYVFSQYVFPVKYGSDVLVSVQPALVFSSSDNDNEILSFAWVKNGFTLEDSATSCTFNSVFPVSGDVSLTGGTIYLESDLHLANITSLGSLGKIDGQGHIITLDSSVKRFVDPTYPMILKNIDLFIGSDLDISSSVRIEGDCYINGHNKRLFLNSSSLVEVGHNSTLWLKDLSIEGLDAFKVKCIDDTGKLLLDNVSLYMDEDYSITSGKLEVWNNVDFYGTHTFFYDCMQTITVAANSNFRFADGVTFAVGVNTRLNRDRILFFEDESSKLWIDNANVILGDAGGRITRGVLILNGKVNFDILSTDTCNGLILGDGSYENDAIAEFYPASCIDFKNGHVVYNEFSPYQFVSKSIYSKLVREAANTFHIAKNQIFSNVTIEVDQSSPLTTDPGVVVGYQDCCIIMPSVKFSITGSRLNTYTMLLSGDNEIFLEEGVLPFYLMIQNYNNVISGNGNLSGFIILYNSGTSLTFNMAGQITNDVMLNGGTIDIVKDLEFAGSNGFLGTGQVSLSNNNLTLGSQDSSWTSTIYWDGDSGSLELNAKLSLSSTWTFSGNCTISGNDNVLDLSSNGKIYIERGSTLRFKNVRIRGLEGSNIACVDDTSKILFDNVLFKLMDDFYFDKGSFDVYSELTVKASGKIFHYRSTMQSSVIGCSTLIFDTNSEFDYNPACDKRNLINLQTADSTLWLKEASLHSSTTGMQLTTGRLFVDGKCPISSDASCYSEAIIFGDGVSALNDLNMKILPGGTFDVTSGHVVSKNITN